MKINLTYPINISENDKIIFDELLNYKVQKPIVKRFKNVFVSHEGLVLHRLFLEKRSGYNLKGKKDINFYWVYWKLIVEQYIVCRFGKSLQSKSYNSKKYAIVHSKWFNYAFWINDSIHRCILLEELNKNEKVTLLLPELMLKNQFVKETLSVFDFEIELIPKDTHCFIENFVLPETREYTSYFDPVTINKIRNKLISHALNKSSASTFPSKIYLSRKERGVRSLINEEEVEQTLINAGFTVLSFDNLSVWDQITYMQHCTWFVSNHGAGFSNCMFMNPNSKVLEFLEYDFAHYGNPFPHWRLATLTGLKYYYLLGKSSETTFIPFVKNRNTNSSTRMGMVNRQIKIDIDLLKNIVNE